MTEPRQSDGCRDSAPIASVSQVCAEFTSSWEAALKSGREAPSIDLFLSRVSLTDRSELQQELNEIHQAYSERFPQSVWTGATIDQEANTPCPKSMATVDSTERVSGTMAGSAGDPAATLEHVSTPPVSGATPDGPGLPNAAFSLEETNRAASDTKGVHVPGYEIVGELGRGGMGVVYKARQIGLNRWVALKMVLAAAHASKHQLDRFLTEAKAVADLQHPNIVQIYENGEYDDLPFFSLEFVGGGSLDAKVHRKAQPPREAAHMVETLAQAVQYAHERGVIHRDLKPANILLTADGIPKITDFGLAKRLAEDSGQTKSGTLMGTPNYMAPEQARGEIQLVGPLADVYTLGAILYELLTGRPPFQGTTVLETVKQVTNDEPVPPSRLEPQVPRDLETICLKCLQKDMGKRYHSARMLADDLRRFLSDEPILARPVSNWERLTRWCRRNPRVAALVGTVAVLLIVVACGSLAFAYRLSQEVARTEEQREIADRKTAAEKSAREEADENAKQARKAQALANEQAGVAVDTLNNVTTKMEEELRDKAGMGPLRLAIVEMALAGLEKVDKTEKTSGLVSRTTGVAYQRIGDVYFQLGQTEKTTELYKRSIDIFERLATNEPGNEQIPWNLAVTYDKMAQTSSEMEGDSEAALKYLTRSLELREALRKNIQTEAIKPARRQVGLAISFEKIASWSMENGDPARARDYARRCLVEAEIALETDPKLALAGICIGDAHYFLGQANAHLAKVDAARESYRECLNQRLQLVKDQPLNDAFKIGLGGIYDVMGDLEVELGNSAGAMESYKRSHEIYVQLNQKDAKDAEIRWYLGNSHYRMGTAEHILGHQDSARGHFLACLRLREDMEKSDPKNFQRQTELLLALARCGQSARAVDIAQSLQKRASRNPAILFIVACGYALCIPGSDQGRSSAAQDQTAVRRGYAEKALEALRQAVAHGFKDIRELEASPDLEPLRSLENYKQLLTQLVKK
jgi:serine/threonine protein kinase/tetratricopeptide (TPR) repeat protein